MGNALAKADSGRYQYRLTGSGECKVVGPTIYIKEAQLHVWQYNYR